MTSATETPSEPPARIPDRHDTGAIEAQRRRLRFRCWHRGTREMDLILGTFADTHIAGFTPNDLNEFDRLLGASDPDLYNWITDREEPSPELRGRVLDLLKAAGPPVDLASGR